MDYKGCDETAYSNCSNYNYSNSDSCNYPFNFHEFSHDNSSNTWNNPFSMVYLAWNNWNNTDFPKKNPEIIEFNMYFFLICYSYSLFRLVVDLAVIIYALKTINSFQSFNNGSSNYKYPNLPEYNKEKNKKIEEDLNYEKKFLKFCVVFAVISEFIMSLHNFIVWRGLQYYTSAQDKYIEFQEKPPRICNCMYNPLLYNLDGGQDCEFNRSIYLTVMYGLWIFFEVLGIIPIYLSILVLSRINRTEKLGKALLIGPANKTLFFGFLYGGLLFLLIFVFNLPVFYKFYCYEILAFWFFWKLVGFFLVLERLNNKYWLFMNLDILSLHSHSKEYEQKLNTLKQKNLEEIEENKLLENENKDKLSEDTIKNIKEDLKENVKSFYSTIQEMLQYRKKKIQKGKLKTKWQDYLNYFLGLNLMGTIGYFFLMIDAAMLENNSNRKVDELPSNYYFIGIFFCYLEIVIFDLTHGILLLHCFFKEQVNSMNEVIDLMNKGSDIGRILNE